MKLYARTLKMYRTHSSKLKWKFPRGCDSELIFLVSSFAPAAIYLLWKFVILWFKNSTILKDSLALKDTTYFEGLTIWSCFHRIFYLFPFIDDLPIKNDIIVQVSLLQNIMKPLQSCHFCAKHKNSLAVRLPFPSCQFTDSTFGWKVD